MSQLAFLDEKGLSDNYRIKNSGIMSDKKPSKGNYLDAAILEGKPFKKDSASTAGTNTRDFGGSYTSNPGRSRDNYFSPEENYVLSVFKHKKSTTQ